MSNIYQSNDDDFMEMGNTGWIPVGQGSYLNKYSGHVLDEMGREYDEHGNLVYDPEDSE